MVESSTLSGGAFHSSLIRALPVGLTAIQAMPSRENIQMLQMLLARLERVSVDSYWAHRASGVRGSLLRTLELLESGEGVSPVAMQTTVEQAFRILERAARERAR